MLKKTAKAVSLIVILAILVTGCGEDKNIEIKSSADKYRNYYEIFVRSFYDSDNNGYGDLQGIIKKLDYLNDGKPDKGNDLGIDGIWLMPIMPSPTYHKYDVKDYYTIDPQYGTMQDFEQLIAKCKERGINVIIDLVLNHTSIQHEWFQSAIKSIAIPDCGESVCTYDTLCRKHNKYCDYYNFSTEKLAGYHSKGMPEGYYYQGVFWDGMPDLNLDNQELRSGIKKIGAFWLEKGVSGFRLDATTEFYDKNITKNSAFLKWFYDEMQSINKDVYMVGEAWTDAGSINQYYQGSGIDSFFNFPYAQGDGIIVKTIRNKSGNLFAQDVEKMQTDIGDDSISASFLSNHDNARSSGYLMRNLSDEKLAASLYMLMPGNSFIYYGEEIGMNGSGIDENKRLPFLWSTKTKEGIANPPPNATQNVEGIEGVDMQIKDKDSLYQFYKKIIKIKNQHQEIAKGKATYIDMKNAEIGAYKCEYQGKSVYIIHNLSDKEVDISLSLLSLKSARLGGELITVEGKIKLANDTVSMPSKSTAVLY